MNLSRNFTLKELTYSRIAIEHGLEGPEKLLEILKASGLDFDQAILYRRKKFLHLSYREGFNRRQVLYG